MHLNQSLKQTLSLSPQMIQAMEILQMDSMELLEHIGNLLEENPVLEVEKINEEEDAGALLLKKLEWLRSTDVQNRSYYLDDADPPADPLDRYAAPGGWEEELGAVLLFQLQTQKHPQALLGAAEFIVESLSENGYLEDGLDVLAKAANCPVKAMEQALLIVQSLDPAGVGARDLKECLRLQLERLGGERSDLALLIVDGHLQALSRRQYGQMAKALGKSEDTVRAACDLIRSLNPRPGAEFQTQERPDYITPDIIVVNFRDHFELLANDYYFPALRVSGDYAALSKQTEDAEVKTYLAGKIRQAKWVIQSVQQRRTTLMRCAEAIVGLQERFFRRGPGTWSP